MTLPELQFASSNFDCVVMLTSSDWHTEMRSNRYHYATRFARTHPVYFVQPDLTYGGIESEKVETHPNLSILHVPSVQHNVLFTPLKNFLDCTGHRRPLLWCYHYKFAPFYSHSERALRVYHATEDFFRLVGPHIPDLTQVLRASDLIVCVSEGVRKSLEEQVGPLAQAYVVTNGCDYAFYADCARSPSPVDALPKPRALYQGNISGKVNYDLMLHTCQALPHVSFVFAGKALPSPSWQQLRACSNVYYIGKMPAEILPAVMAACDVGLIPYVQEDWIVKPGFPLKTFEYLAAGLPVVSTPLDNLQPFQDVIRFAGTPDDFVAGIQEALGTRSSEEVERRRAGARAQDYDGKFAQVRALLSQLDGGTRVYQKDKERTALKHVYLLIPGEPTRDASFDLNSVSADGPFDVTVIELERRPESDRDLPLLEKNTTCTVIRRPLISVHWRDYLTYGQELMTSDHKGSGIALGLLLISISVVLALGNVPRRAVRFTPVWVRSVLRRLLFAISSARRRRHFQNSGKNVRGWERTSLIRRLIQTTHTLLHAVQETMVEPDIVHSRNLDSLLAGVVCKRRFGSKLVYEVHEAGVRCLQPRNRFSVWLLTTLERSLISRTDDVISVVPQSAKEMKVRHHLENINAVAKDAEPSGNRGAAARPSQRAGRMN